MRLAGAARGWAFTAAPVVVVALLQVACMPWIAQTTLGLNPAIEPRIVAGLRRMVPAMHAPALVVLGAYWLAAALLCRRSPPRRGADRVLLASGVPYIFFHVVSSTMSRHRFGSLLCRPLGISEASSPPYGFDIPSPCDDFNAAVAFWLWVGVPLALLAISLVIRIVAYGRSSGG